MAKLILISNNSKSNPTKKLLDLNNSKNSNESLKVIKEKAKERILVTSLTISLLLGAVDSTSVKDNYEARLFRTLESIESAKKNCWINS